MRKVAIIGIGQVPVREHWDSPLRGLAVKALWNALDDAGIQNVDGLFVGNMLSGFLSEQEHLGALVADYAGLENVEAYKIEAACGSGAAAFRQAVMAVGCGSMESAAVVGVEKLTEFSGKFSTSALATAADADYETSIGLTFVAINAIIMQRYIHEYGYKKSDFSIFPVNAHKNAIYNPNAIFNNTISAEDYIKSKMIADPINLLDSSPIADGAAALIVIPFNEISKYRGIPVEVAAVETGMDTIAVHDRKDLLWFEGVEKSVKKALVSASVTLDQVDLFETHDAFSIVSALALECSGFADRGEAIRYVEKTGIDIKGNLPLNTMGGLKGRGHPVGATGIYQIVETAMQLRGEAGDSLQIENARTGMAQNIGGSGATVVTSILKKLTK